MRSIDGARVQHSPQLGDEIPMWVKGTRRRSTRYEVDVVGSIQGVQEVRRRVEDLTDLVEGKREPTSFGERVLAARIRTVARVGRHA